MRFIWILIVVCCLSGCSIIDACFNSHLATQGRKYNSYGKSKSGTKSYAAKRPKRATKSKMSFASEKKSTSKNAIASTTLSAVASTNSTQRIVYSKAELKKIKKENKRLYKKSKRGKGKFRYSYDIPSPYNP